MAGLGGSGSLSMAANRNASAQSLKLETLLGESDDGSGNDIDVTLKPGCDIS